MPLLSESQKDERVKLPVIADNAIEMHVTLSVHVLPSTAPLLLPFSVFCFASTYTDGQTR